MSFYISQRILKEIINSLPMFANPQAFPLKIGIELILIRE